MDDGHLKPIKGDRPGHKPRAGRRRNLGQSEQVTCSTCLAETGVETSRFRKAVIAPRRDPDGRIRAGKSVWVCDHCGTQVS